MKHANSKEKKTPLLLFRWIYMIYSSFLFLICIPWTKKCLTLQLKHSNSPSNCGLTNKGCETLFLAKKQKQWTTETKWFLEPTIL